MEIHRQQCQQCGSWDARNILVRDTDAPMTIYVHCLGCGAFVARYKLSEYYLHGKGIESFLRCLGAAAGESGRDYLAEFQRIQDEALRGYEEVRRELEKTEKEA